jgi:hypothetical protein
MKAMPELARGERPLHRSERGGATMVGTERALYIRAGGSAWRRHAWTELAFVGWSKPDRCIIVRPWPAGHHHGPDLRVPAQARFTTFARERVISSRLLCVRVQLTPRCAATAIALRSSVDAITWRFLLDQGVNADDPSLVAACDRAIAELQHLVGY